MAIVGTGHMAHTHAKRFGAIKGVQLVACCDVDGGRARDFATAYRIPHSFHDFTEMLDAVECDAVTNVTPDASHARLSIEACARGKHVFCEKPLATNYADALKMQHAAKDAGVISMVNFSYRNSAALQQVAKRVRKGDLGRVFHVQAHYLQSWLTSKEWGDWRTGEKWLWRLSAKHGSKGVLGDVGVHILDFASFPVGDLISVNCLLKTFPKAPRNRIKNYPLDANDSAVITAQYANGAIGAVQTTRFATGHVNTLSLSIHGELGAFRINLDTSYTDYEECFVQKRDGKTSPWATVNSPAVPTLYERFIRSINKGEQEQPDFSTGAKIQRAQDACEKSNAENSRTIELKG